MRYINVTETIYQCFIQCRYKTKLRGSNNGRNGQCGGCRAPATWRENHEGRAYIGGYSEPFEFVLDPRFGPELFFCGDERLRLTHDEMWEQGLEVRRHEKLVANGEIEKARLEEFKAAFGCRGLCDAIRKLTYSDYSTFFGYPICHTLLLGLKQQFPSNIRDKVGGEIFNAAVREADLWLIDVRSSFELKRPVKRILPASSNNLFSGYKIEDHLHMMETFEPMVFYQIFDNIGPDGLKYKIFYFRFVSAAMFLLRGGPKLRFTGDGLEGEALENKLKEVNDTISRHRRDFNADTKACCTMAQQLLLASYLSPNLHSLFCMIPFLLDKCGHPKFEVCIERLVSIPN